VRLEVIALPSVCNEIANFMRREILDEQHVTVCIETVDVLKVGPFTPIEAELAGQTH
jgi:3-deoxy-D-arabino-heptulosonate 7-phosphate (DAHP) synthase